MQFCTRNADFVDVVGELIERGLAQSARSAPRRLGAFAGSVQISEDFDDVLPELTAAIDART